MFSLNTFIFCYTQDEKQSDLLGEIEALGAELRKSREELDKTQFEVSSCNFQNYVLLAIHLDILDVA